MATTQDGEPVPSYRINCELDRRRFERDTAGHVIATIDGKHDADGRCCVVGLRAIAGLPFALEGDAGKCTVCGAACVYGDVWQHNPTGEIIFIGHTCADKYQLLVSDKQIALALRLASEARDNPQPKEVNVQAPTGKQTFRGIVVSRRTDDGPYGPSVRMTVKVTTPDGVWLAWGTAPLGVLSESNRHGGLTRCEVEVTATLKPGRDPHFALMQRPRAKIVKHACPTPCRGCEEDAGARSA